MLKIYPPTPVNNRPTITENEQSDGEVMEELRHLKDQIKHKTLVLGHHYQNDDIISFADERGDSLQLAKKAQQSDCPYIVFCGVHFMAETADMLTGPEQQVILPDLNAGCTMADMADRRQIDRAWEYIKKSTPQKVIPITYVNCDAQLKAFVGDNGGAICTSSNAQKIIQWAFRKGEKLMFFPDQHLGRNTCYELGIPLDEMVVYNPLMQNGGLTPAQIDQARVILWYGYCSVHQGFSADQVISIKKNSPETTVIVHPECNFDVVQAADMSGSTSFILKTIQEAPEGSAWAVGTEINLVNRLSNRFLGKKIFSLSPYQCLCTTMYRVRPRWLLASFRAILQDKPINTIKVSSTIQKSSLVALDRMLEIV